MSNGNGSAFAFSSMFSLAKTPLGVIILFIASLVGEYGVLKYEQSANATQITQIQAQQKADEAASLSKSEYEQGQQQLNLRLDEIEQQEQETGRRVDQLYQNLAHK